MERRRTWISALVPLGVIASCVSGTASSPPSSTHARAVMTWIPAYAGDSAAPRSTSITAAQDVGMIGAHPWTYRPDLARIRRDDPNLVLLAYMNGTFAQASQGRTYPSSWYLRDAAGRRVRSREWGNYLMDPTNPGWIEDRAARCRHQLLISGYDGCLVDMLGTAPIYGWYVTSPPIDPATGARWTAASWLAATTRLGASIRSGNASATVIANGLGDGGRFFNAEAPSEQILQGVDGGIAETWLRAAAAPVGRYPRPGAWKRDIDMLSATNKSIYVETKLWTTATTAKDLAWHRFSLASFLLGNDGNDYYAFSDDQHGPEPDHLAASIGLGSPTGAYRSVDGMFERSFSNGIVVVNPTAVTASTDLGAEYRNQDGAVASSVTLDGHSAMILTTP